MIVLAVLIFVFICCVSLLLYGRKNYGILEKCGIPVVQPTLFLGSVPDFHSKVHQIEDIKRFKKYGPIWGVYEGQDPQIHIADPELVRLIFVKDFDYFHDRRTMDFGSNVFNEILDYLPGRKWKTVRQMLTPMLTKSKLNLMSQVINESATEFAEDLKNECVDGKIKIDCRRFELKALHGLLDLSLTCKIHSRMTTWLIDMFTRATLGVQMGNAKDPKNEFAVAFRTFMGEDTVFDWIYSLSCNFLDLGSVFFLFHKLNVSVTFPFLIKFAPTFDNEPTNLIERIFRQILQSRRSTAEKKNSDFVDILNELIDRTKTNEYKELQITEDTIISQAVNFFLGGYETSGTTSTVLLYYLARNLNVQRNLQREIDSIYEKTNGNIDHDAIREEETPYLTACINEALRLGPPLYRPERVCTKDWSYGNIRIKRTTTIFLCLWALHRDESYFDDPDEFKPERFLPENKDRINQYAFVPFGLGPRACIGIRFAYESLKLLFIHLIRNFEVKMRDDTNLQYKPGQQIIVAFKPLYLDLVKREK
ncbi:hypothetical protein HA402_012783 [Bradysia odoriphaga]|nr:hypothetical protein HA402_012783 [Bradysia odoriphaga]